MVSEALSSLAGCTRISIPLKQFLTTQTCPPPWLACDLYLFHDEVVVFYVGQSDLAFARVWRHLHDGFKGRSLVGKFVRANWPRSLNFTVTLLMSTDRAFAAFAHDRSAVEAHLINTLRPCLNDSLNTQPTPLPPCYAPPTKTVRFPRHIGRMMREAEVAWQQAQNSTEW
jgi:hypothetical protein